MHVRHLTFWKFAQISSALRVKRRKKPRVTLCGSGLPHRCLDTPYLGRISYDPKTYDRLHHLLFYGLQEALRVFSRPLVTCWMCSGPMQKMASALGGLKITRHEGWSIPLCTFYRSTLSNNCCKDMDRNSIIDTLEDIKLHWKLWLHVYCSCNQTALPQRGLDKNLFSKFCRYLVSKVTCDYCTYACSVQIKLITYIV